MGKANYQTTNNVSGMGQVGNNIYVDVSDFETRFKDLSNNITYLAERIENLSELALHAKIKGRFLTVLSAVVLIACIFAICTSLTSFSLDSTAYLGWTVASLSTMIVVLMGWQIFNIIEFKGHREEAKEMVRSESASLRKKIAGFQEQMVLLESAFVQKLEEYKIELPKKIEEDKKRKETREALDSRYGFK